MQFHPSFEKRLGTKTNNEVFDFLCSTFKLLRPTSPTYFVNWYKALENTARVEMALHQLDYLIGKSDMGLALFNVIKANPMVVEALPSVFASRAKKFLLVSKATGPAEFEFLARSVKTDYDIRRIVAFCDEIGLLNFIEKATISSFTDYVHGVEVGIDTNGRKNRGGKQMEESVEEYVSAICTTNGYDYLAEATASQIASVFGKTLSVDKTNRRIDFAIDTPRQLFLIETNYYDGGGSKLKATAGEYKTLYDLVRKDGHQFIWVTDGRGWLTTLNSLRETFDYTDYILNLEMVGRGVLEDLLAP